MKKVLMTVAIAAAFAFGMTACNNNATENTQDTAAENIEAPAQEGCCEHACQDSTCTHDCATCPKAGTEECCKNKAKEGCEHACKHEGAAQEGCQNHEGCEHACQHEAK